MRPSTSIFVLAAAAAFLSPLGTAHAQTGCLSETFSAAAVNRGEHAVAGLSGGHQHPQWSTGAGSLFAARCSAAG